METKHKNLLIGGLLAIVLIMAVGYAAFATQLNINGTANITSTWDVHIKSIEVASQQGTASSVKQVVEEGNLTATFETQLVSPGDSITYNVTVENTGSLDAKLSTIAFTQGQTNTETEEGKDNRTIIYSYSGIAENDVLAAGDETTFTVTVLYNPAITSQPAEADKTSELTMTLTYVQNVTTTTTPETPGA